MFGLFMYFVIALSSVWFYRAYLRRSLGVPWFWACSR